MAVSSVINYRTLKTNIVRALESYIKIYNKHLKNGNIRVYHKVRLVILKRCADYVLNRIPVYTTHSVDSLYEKGEIVVSGSDYYICFKDTTLGILVTNKTYWSPYPAFTYDYDELITVLNIINRICGTNLTI